MIMQAQESYKALNSSGKEGKKGISDLDYKQ